MTALKVEISARHVHLTESDAKILFPGGIDIRKRLSIDSEYVLNQKVEIFTNNTDRRKAVLTASVLGPFRKSSQLEISRTDALFLGIDAPERLSGDLENAPQVFIRTEHGTISVPVIIPIKHVHVPVDSHFIFHAKLDVKINSHRGEFLLRNIPIRPTEHCYMPTFHVDTDEGNCFGIDETTEASILLPDPITSMINVNSHYTSEAMKKFAEWREGWNFFFSPPTFKV